MHLRSIILGIAIIELAIALYISYSNRHFARPPRDPHNHIIHPTLDHSDYLERTAVA